MKRIGRSGGLLRRTASDFPDFWLNIAMNYAYLQQYDVFPSYENGDCKDVIMAPEEK